MNSNPTLGTPVPPQPGSRFWEDNYNLAGLLLVPLTCIVTFLVIYANTNYGFLHSIPKGIYWGLVIYCLVIIPSFWVIIPGNTAVIYQNILAQQPIATRDEDASNVVKPFVGQRALMAGPRFRLPGIERPLGDPIKMIVEKNLKLVVSAIDEKDQKYIITSSMPVSPIPGIWLTNYIRISDQAATEHFEGVLKPFIEQNFATRDGAVVIRDIEGFRKHFEDNVLDGSEKFSEAEKFTGRFGFRPRIESVVKEKVAQEADEALSNAQKAAAIAKVLHDSGMNKESSVLRALVMIGQGEGIEAEDISLTVRGLEGLEKLDISGLADLLRNKGKKGRGGKGGGGKPSTP